MREGRVLHGALRIVALGVLALSACRSTPPAAPAAPPAPVAPEPSPPVPAPPPAASPAAEAKPPPPSPPPITVYEADLYGSIKARYGTTVSISSRLMTSKTPPATGMKGVLYRKVPRGGDDEWLAIAGVVIKDPPDALGTLKLTITDEKKGVLLDGKRVDHFVKGVDVRLTWEW